MRRTLRMRLSLLYGSVFFATGTVLLAFVLAALWSGKSVRETAPVPGQQVEPGGVSIAQQQHGFDLHILLIASAAGLLIMAVVSAVSGWMIAGRALRPLSTMMATARAISADSLHSRIGLQSPYAEFQELGATLDDLFGRLDATFQSQRHFVANASHELRTPLTAERALLQVALADPDISVETLRAACVEVLALGAGQERLIESLLTLASSEQGVERWEPLDLGAIAGEVLAVRQGEASRRAIEVVATLDEASIPGDPRLVESLVANLIDNAIRHNVAGGRVEVKTAETHLTVRNTGAPIPPDDIDRLFVPFQRMRTARVGHPDGHGLGLAIVRAIATAHGAVITIGAPASGGLDIDVTFPAHQPIPGFRLDGLRP